MRIGHVVQALATGGLERVVCDLASHQPGAVVYCLDEAGELAAAFPALRVEVIGARRRGRPYMDWAALGRLRRCWQRDGIDLVHTHGMAAHQYGGLAARLARLPSVHTKHGRDAGGGVLTPLKNHLRSWLSDRLVAVSADAREVLLRRERVPARKVQVIRNGIDAARYCEALPGPVAALRRELGLAPGEAVVGSVGRLAEIKRYRDLLAAVAQLAVPPRLLLVGEGPERPRLEAQARALGIAARLTLAGRQADVRPWLQLMDCFVLCSRSEGTAVALLEAGASAVPAVVTAVGGNPEVVADGESGLLVPVGQPAALAHALAGLLADPARRRTLGQGARVRIETHYSLARTLHEYDELYRSLA